MQGQELVGRSAELALLEAFLVGARDGGGVQVLSGQPGIGKTALLDAAAGIAARRGTTVLRAAAVESETDLGLAVLNQILLPLLDRLDRLDRAHRDALAVALGLGVGPAVSRADLAAATLALLRAVGDEAPVLLVLDDLQWTDRASAGVLGAVARRLTGTRIGLLAAWRAADGGFFERAGLPVHEVPPLDDDAAAALLAGRFPRLPARVRRRLLHEAGGNPLALLALPAPTDDGRRSDDGAGRGDRPVGGRLHEVFAARVGALPEADRRLLLMAALEGTGDLGLLIAAGGAAELSGPQEELVDVDPVRRRMVFRHPIVRSAVLAGSTAADRQQAHRLLAGALGDQPGRQARHLAAATTGPDAAVAAALEESARRAEVQGDPAGAVSALLQAAELSPESDDRVRRLGEAAYLGAGIAGDLDAASRALAEARRVAPGRPLSLPAATGAAFLLLNSDGDVETAFRLLAGTITARVAGRADGGVEVDGEVVAAVSSLLELALAGARLDHWQQFHRVRDRLAPGLPPFLHMIVDVVADPVRTAGPALPQLEAAIAGLDREPDLVRARLVAVAALMVDRMEGYRDVARRAVRDARTGDVPVLALPQLLHLVVHEFLTGRWDDAESLAREGAELSARLGYWSVFWPFRADLAILAAVRGDRDAVRDLAGGVVGWATPRGVNSLLLLSHYAQGLAALGDGDAEEAYRHVTAITPAGEVSNHVGLAHWVVLDLVEAATATGRHAEAAAHVAAAAREQVAALSPRAALLATAAAAVAAGEDAGTLFERALAVPGAARWPFEYARVQLLHGEHLRRSRAATAARTRLAAALDAFEQLGARPWSRRAAGELRAAGGPSPAGPAPAAGLTPQESEVVSLAAAGLTNAQIAQRLRLSRRTVDVHLYRAFAKLGVRTRAALGSALERSGEVHPPERV